MLTLGIIGYGFMGQWHAYNALTVEGVSLAGIYDIDRDCIHKARENNVHAYDSMEELLADSRINLVVIATPNHTHMPIALSALAAGKNVICEKPAALSNWEFEQIHQAALQRKRLFTVHHNRRWDRDYATVCEAIGQGMIGDVHCIESRVFGSGGIVHGWRLYPEYGGGMMYDWGVHLIDQVLMMNPHHRVTAVYAQLFHVVNQDVDDFFKLILQFETGLSAQIEVGTFTLRKMPRWFIQGNEGTLAVDDWECHGGITRKGETPARPSTQAVSTAAGPTRTMATRLDDAENDYPLPACDPDWKQFYRNIQQALDGTAELLIQPDQVARTMKVIDAAFLSHQQKRSVTVDI